MTIEELDKKMNEALAAFSHEVSAVYGDGSAGEIVRQGDIVDSSKQAFYCMNDFRKLIIQYLKESK